MKLGYHHRRLLQHLLDHPDCAHGLHTQQVKRKAESLIKMGYIDEFWRVTEAGKSRLANEEEQQHQQQTLSEGCLNQASEAIGRDIPNTAAQAELLRAEQLSLQHNAQLAYYAQAKAQQIDTLQAALQTALHNHVAKLAAIEHHAPAWPANRQARSAWQNQLAQAKTRLAHSSNDGPKGWGRSPRAPASTLTLCSTSSPLANCVFVIQTSPADGTLFNNSNAKPLYKRFTPLRPSNSTWVELAL